MGSVAFRLKFMTNIKIFLMRIVLILSEEVISDSVSSQQKFEATEQTSVRSLIFSVAVYSHADQCYSSTNMFGLFEIYPLW